jgi:lysophospholipase L1-like esterase
MNGSRHHSIGAGELETAAPSDWASSTEAAALRVQFHRIAQILKGLPGSDRVPDHIEAEILGCDVGFLRDVRQTHTQAVMAAVDDLLARPGPAELVAKLRDRYAGAIIVCLGDSITADHESWAEMLAVALAPDVHVINEGRSGDTTTDLLSRFAASVPVHRPDVVLVFAGTNDARTYRTGTGQLAVSDEESRRNFAELAQLIAHLGADLAWLTPARIDDERVLRHPNTASSGAVWTNAAAAGKAALLHQRPEHTVDLQAEFAVPRDTPDLLMPDGLHPSLAGQTVICLAALGLLSRLAVVQS